MTALAGGAKDAKIEDFMPQSAGAEEEEWQPKQTWQEQLAIMEALAARSAQNNAGS